MNSLQLEIYQAYSAIYFGMGTGALAVLLAIALFLYDIRNLLKLQQKKGKTK